MATHQEGAGSAQALALDRYLHAFWCLSNNAGDAFTPWLIQRMTGKWAIHTAPESSTPKVIVAGSILNWAHPNTTVWGAGLAQPGDGVNAKADVRMTRGPLSRAVAMHYGHRPSEVCGDPGLLVRRYFTPSGEKTHKVGIVPHYCDQADALDRFSGADDVCLINVFDPIDEILEAISRCEVVASSSLHGLVFADALGVKSVWCVFKRGVFHPFKFHDYLLSVGLDSYDPIRMDDRARALTEINDFTQREIHTDLDGMLVLCPFGGAG